MAVTLTTDAKNWIAQNLGIGDCMTEVAQSFTYRDSVNNIDISDSGGTATIVNRLIDSIVPYVTIGETQYTYAALKTQNNNVELVYPDDVQWVMANDSGASQHCVGVTPTCTPGDRRCRTSTVIEQCKADGSGWEDVETAAPGFTCQGGAWVEEAARPVTGPLQVYVGGGEACDPAVEGDPSVTLDTSEAFAYFKAEPVTYVGVMDILVQNLSDRCFAYFAWEMSMWDGVAGETCPITTPERKQITRYLGEVSDKKIISVTRTNASENKMIGGSFEIPATLEGIKTICLSLWGNFNKQALLDELAVAGYEEEIDW